MQPPHGFKRLTAGQVNKRLDQLRAKADRLEPAAIAATEDLQGPGVPMFEAYEQRKGHPAVAAFLAAWADFSAFRYQVASAYGPGHVPSRVPRGFTMYVPDQP